MTTSRQPEVASRSGNRGSGSTRLSPGTASLLAGGVITALLISFGSAVRAWYDDPFRGTVVLPPVDAVRELVGRKVSLPHLDKKRRSIPRGRMLFTAPAPCGSCTSTDKWIDSLRGTSSIPVVATFSSNDHEIESALARRASRVLQADVSSNGKVGVLLNDISPRFAVMGASGRITDVSDPMEPLQEFWERIRRK